MEALTAVLNVFASIGDWIVDTVLSLVPLFYVDGTGLTIMGVLLVTGLGIGIIFLLVGFIQNFFRLRT